MKVSYQWLNEYIDIRHKATAQALAEQMSRTGIEVEGVDNLGAGLKKLVVGEVLSVTPHPDADNLSVCQVAVGSQHAEDSEGVLQIVCGAPNVAAEQKVIVALHGARIAGNVKISRGKIRGQVSQGMLCSLQELGFSASVVPKHVEHGIYVLPADATVGTDVVSYLQLDDDVLELSITPNRADALSMHGVVHEVRAIYDERPVFLSLESTVDTTRQAADMISVAVNDEADVPAYHLFVIDEITVGESPLWMQMKLMKAGIRPINNVVDVTNYILLEYGQPLHAFDYDKITSRQITTRRALSGEQLVTLDGQTRSLTPAHVVITDGHVPIALAGVMGGADTEVTSETKRVALEAALFNPTLVRRAVKDFNLRSESSTRFEKGINRATVKEAGERAAHLMARFAGGKVLSGQVSEAHQAVDNTVISVSFDRLQKVLGIRLAESDLEKIFKRLGFTATFEEDDIVVVVPPRRWDITIAADIYEEVARIYGYDKITESLPMTAAVAGKLSPFQQFRRHTRQLFASSGYSQVISYSLTTAERAALFSLTAGENIALDLPMSEARAVLRQSLLSTLLETAQYNVARNAQAIALFETGHVFSAADTDTKALEVEHFAGVLLGQAVDATWYTPSRPVDFYDVKGVFEAYFASLGLTEQVRYVPENNLTNCHPGRTALIQLNGETIGFIGQLHPAFAKANDLPETYVFECQLLPIFNAQQEAVNYTPIPRFPSMTRDLALLVPQSVSHQSVVDILWANGGKYLVDVQLFDRYQGVHIADDQQSLAYRLTFQNSDATLVEEEVVQAMSRITDALAATGDIHIR